MQAKQLKTSKFNQKQKPHTHTNT